MVAIIGLLLLGLALGSFVNALVWRLRQQETANTKSKADSEDLSILKGRSMCPECGHRLSLWDLVPLLSWIGLGGRCRYCQKPISWQYPLVELLTAALFLVSYLHWPAGFEERGLFMFVVWLVTLTGLVALAVYDYRWMILPDRIIYPLLALVAVAVATDALVFGGGFDAVQNALLGLVFCGGVFYVLFQLSGGRWIGGGDVKLGFLLGLVVGGPLKALLVIFVASLLGTLASAGLLAAGKLGIKSRIPFGPFLIVAAVVVLLWGTELASWYWQLLAPQ